MASFRVTRGVHIFGAAGPGPSTVAVSPAADPTRAFPRLTNVLKASAGRDVASTATLGNDDLGGSIPSWTGSAYEVQRAATAEAQDHRFYGEVVEDVLPDSLRAAHGLTLRQLASERLNAGAFTQTTPAVPGIVSLAQCVPWLVALRSADTGQEWSDAAGIVELDGLGRLVYTRSQADSATTYTTAVLELGSSWSVRGPLTISTTDSGVDVPIAGAGPEPWSQKLFVTSWRPQAAFDTIAAIPSYRASPSDPDSILFFRPVVGALAGVAFHASFYVLHHPLLQVQHFSSIDTPALGDLEASETDYLRAIPSPVTAFEDEVSLIGSATHPESNLGYPRMHLGYTLEPGGTAVRWRRGRTVTADTAWSMQVVRWPQVAESGGSRQVGGHTAFSRQVG